MACYQKMTCPQCGSERIIKFGVSPEGEQRYRCQNTDCDTTTFMQTYRYKADEQGVKKQIVDMAINGSGIRDTARVLQVSKNTVMSTLKKGLKRPYDQSELPCQRVPQCPYSQVGVRV